MSIAILSTSEVEGMRKAGRVAAETLRQVTRQIQVGTTTEEIDTWVRLDTKRRGAVPSQLGYQGFPRAVCTSVNHVVCHGIPSALVRLKPGDILNVDVTSEFEGFVGDTSTMVELEPATPEGKMICEVAKKCLNAGISAVHPGAYLRDIAIAVSEMARAEGCSVVRELGGHGIGRAMHLPPHVSFVPGKGRGPRLRPGMAFTIEPMINAGGPEVRFLDDGWTVETADGRLSAQYEHTVLVTEHGVEILTQLEAPAEALAGTATEELRHTP